MSAGFKAKPYKLKPSDGAKITRDDVSTWSYTLQSCARQVKDWIAFLPGNSKAKWIAKSEDASHGWKVTKMEDDIEVDDDEATDALKSHFQDFLTFIASYCPSGFMNQVMRESTSFEWIIDQLHSTYGLETRGENFLTGNDIKFEFSPTFTYNQALMSMKDFYVNSLLGKNSLFKGKALNKDEELSPLAENFIIEKCLFKIDPRLPEHIKNTKGHLFTEERPTLACNQRILFAQIDTMLAELDGKDTGITVGQIRTSQSFRPQRYASRPQNQRFRNSRPMPRVPFLPQRRPAPTFRPNRPGCIRCIEARRYDASKFHSVQECPYPRYQNQGSGMKVLLVQDQSSANNLPAKDEPNYEAEQFYVHPTEQDYHQYEEGKPDVSNLNYGDYQYNYNGEVDYDIVDPTQKL